MGVVGHVRGRRVVGGVRGPVGAVIREHPGPAGVAERQHHGVLRHGDHVGSREGGVVWAAGCQGDDLALVFNWLSRQR